MSIVQKIIGEIREKGNNKKAALLSRFFKTGKGEYGAGDMFLGLTIPKQREIAKKYRDLPLTNCETLLHNPHHECRMTALLILTDKFNKANPTGQHIIYDMYLRNTKYINNWDLVDLSSKYIMGGYLLENPQKRTILHTLAQSPLLWDRRIAVLATFAFLNKGDCTDSLALAELLIHDPEDLIHKAVGWMLREVGKKDQTILEQFLDTYKKRMPRTMLRYAIEKFSSVRRQKYLSK